MHDLEITANGGARMVYSERVAPWHGLGKKINGLTLAEAEEVLNLEDLVKIPLYGRLMDREIATRHAAIVAPSTGEVLSVMSADYEIHQPRPVLSFFQDFCDAGKMQLETVGFLNRGRRMWALASIGKNYQLTDGDTISGYLLLATSFDGTLATQARDTQICVVCQNTLSAATTGRSKRDVSIRHSTALTPDIIRQAQAAMGLATERFQNQIEIAQRLAEIPVSSQFQLAFAHFLTDMPFAESVTKLAASREASVGITLYRMSDAVSAFDTNPDINTLSRKGRAIYDEILHSPGNRLPNRQDTAWGLLNGITSYADHIAGRDRDTALQSAWFGPAQTLKDRASTVLTEVLAG